MNTDALQELYQQVILEHNKKPRNFGKLIDATHHAEGFNPLCGDHLHVYLLIDANHLIQKIQFEGSGCAISKSSASLMTQAVTGKTESEIRTLFDQFHNLVVGKQLPDSSEDRLGKLKVFSGIWRYPSRVKCASLAWHALKSALDNVETVTTE